jgi:outer membrane immunogenic protein
MFVMKKLSLLAAAGLAAMTVATGAQAQDTASATPYVGLTGGYHSIDDDGVLVTNDGAIFGAVAGVDVPVGGRAFVGVEGNFNIGTSAIDSEYGVAARLGVNVGDNASLYVRGGYQEVNFDLARISGGVVTSGIDDTDGGYLVGLGTEFGIGEGPVNVRLGVDTIEFDTFRATAGVVFKF